MSSAKQTCANCGADNATNARFCGSCGVSLQTSEAPPANTSSETPFASPTGDIHGLTFDQALLTAPRPHRRGGRWLVVAAAAGGLLLIVLAVIQFVSGLSSFGQVIWVLDGIVVIALVAWLWGQYNQRRTRHGATDARRWLYS